ncbi:phage shock protein operon transcriptional activator [Halioxenophilus sp. WMMB6]|uniref:phage shock protein operon transcriptional activator n=1 Tax=Halioxenophilus sp. WMMB6 TaxID=3073815 RepID=UPI00295F0388|nr:phage shock protein operon transcriptional activator [Halioxenophilus sp. WMMB6]
MVNYLVYMAESSVPRKTTSALGESPLYLAALDQASRLANLDRPALIIGERGSGKELIAHRMHFLSPSWEEPYLKVNCAALTESLVESTLFGHEAGAFTGASRSQPGYFERAGHGTLFLDEIATLSLRIQEKLLRVLEYGEYERLGGQRTLETQARVIAATHADLAALAGAGEFRHDLLDRLAFDVVHMPPLRLREEDVLLLANHFAVSFVRTLGWDYFPGFSEQAEQQLLSHPWPGNVRELKNVVERSLFRADDSHEPLATLVIDPFTAPWQARPENSKPIPKPLPINQTAETKEPYNFRSERAAWELEQLQRALALCDHHQGRTAAYMGLSYDQFRALWRRLKRGDSD